MTSLEELPTEEVVVKTAPTVSKTAIGTKEFSDEFIKEIKAGQAWRTPASLASKLGVDAVDLTKWMDRVPELARRPSKEDGVFYYGLAPKSEPIPEKDNKKLTRPVITEEDRYCAANLQTIYSQLLRTHDKYAMRIHDKSPEAFAALSQARDRLSAGTVLFQHVTKTDVEKLPKL